MTSPKKPGPALVATAHQLAPDEIRLLHSYRALKPGVQEMIVRTADLSARTHSLLRATPSLRLIAGGAK